MAISNTRVAAPVAVGLIALFAAACGTESVEPSYTATVYFNPNRPVTEKPVQLRVEVASKSGPVAGATVNVSGSSGTNVVAPVTLVATEKPGEYLSRAVVFPAEGTYALKLNISASQGAEEHNLQAAVSCGGNGEEGATCCAEDVCAAGLSCVFGVCSKGLAADTAPCHEAADCVSGVCTDNLCAVAVCDDKVHNGAETDLDCGGTCKTKCVADQKCKVNADCKHNNCISGLCGLAPGQLIGKGDGTKGSVKQTVILDQQLYNPADLDFSTLKSNEIWIVNPPTDSITVVFNPGKKNQSSAVINDISQHFLENVMTIDFSPNNSTFGTCGESNNAYGGKAKPNFFMGPVLWPAQYQDYTKVGSAHQVHGDMLHSTPYCMGMAAASENKFYVFNGALGTIDWYDFKVPHKPGGTDHSDGVKRRYDGVSVKRKQGVPSHMDYDQKSGWLYIADTGNGRVIRMNDKQSTKGAPLFGGKNYVFFQDGPLNRYSAPKVQQLTKPKGGFTAPSGIARNGDVLYVGDAGTGKIHAFDASGDGMDGAGIGAFGSHLNSYDTGLGPNALGGIDVGPDSKLYFLDRKGRKLVRLDP